MHNAHRSWLVVAAMAAVIVVLGVRAFGTPTEAQEQRVRSPQFIWSPINDAGGPASLRVYRASVPGGWLVLVHHKMERGQKNGQGYGLGAGIGSGVTFVPDSNHTWKTP